MNEPSREDVLYAEQMKAYKRHTTLMKMLVGTLILVLSGEGLRWYSFNQRLKVMDQSAKLYSSAIETANRINSKLESSAADYLEQLKKHKKFLEKEVSDAKHK